MVNEKIEIPLGRNKKLFIYVQSPGKYMNINFYYYDKLPYDDGVDSTSSVFSFQLRFRI